MSADLLPDRRGAAIDTRGAAVLGLPGVLAQVAEYCAGSAGRRQVLASRVYTDPQAVLAERAPGAELRRLLDAGFAPPALDLPDIEAPLGRLRRGAALLEPEELAAVGRLASTAEAIRGSLAAAADPVERPALSALCAELPPLGTLAAELRRVVGADGAIQDRAVPELARVKRDLRRLQRQVEAAAGGLMADPALRGCFNGTVPTQRGGRTVVPVKATHRGRVPGVVHEVSASGATIFVEPLRDVEANNAVVAARDRYAAEVRRVLRALTAAAARERPALDRAAAVTARFDCVQARARYARAHEAVAAPVGPLQLRRARHPELGAAAVPLNLAMALEARVMIITGPNTGGKTVCLKTVGLLCLMNQAGMEIPAAPDSTLPVYRGIYADIGDAQSIAESLSTFSAHVENLAAIMRGATERSLVLIDELGTGTDPEEGIALSRALLDRFRAAGVTVIATTHHGALKVYAYTEAGVANASMEFDARTLRPTYRVIEGVPGESHAIDIARRHRMPDAVIERAARLLDAGRTESGRIVDELTRRQQEQERQDRALRERRLGGRRRAGCRGSSRRGRGRRGSAGRAGRDRAAPAGRAGGAGGAGRRRWRRWRRGCAAGSRQQRAHPAHRRGRPGGAAPPPGPVSRPLRRADRHHPRAVPRRRPGAGRRPAAAAPRRRSRRAGRRRAAGAGVAGARHACGAGDPGGRAAARRGGHARLVAVRGGARPGTRRAAPRHPRVPARQLRGQRRAGCPCRRRRTWQDDRPAP